MNATEQISALLVEEQLQRVKSSPLFSHSRRCPTLLDYVVKKKLQGQQDLLKERIVGIEAFGRSPEYDLNTDPVVRVTAGEVRKRLAQYYYQPEHQYELRIELKPGSYVPEFRFAEEPGHSAEAVPKPFSVEEATLPERIDADQPHAPSDGAERRPFFIKRRIAVIALASVCVVALLMGAVLRFGPSSPYDDFWRGVFQSPGPVLISVGSVVVLNPPVYKAGPSPSSVGIHALFADPVALADTIAIANFEHVLSKNEKSSTIQSSTATSYSDLQKGPVILISGFNNPWTMRLTSTLRYHLVQKAVDVYEIQDSTDPVQGNWAINTRTDFSQSKHDYGLVARVHDPTTEQIAIVAAGIGEDGTIAASELLSEKKYLSQLKEQGVLPKRNQNWEAVIETQMIDGKPGPPHVVASYSW